MTWPWKKKKPKEELEFKGEEREVSLTTPIGGFKRKTVYGVKESKETGEIQVFEDTISINPEQYETIALGEVKRGKTIALECKDLLGRKFSFYILDTHNLKYYKRGGRAGKPLRKGIYDNEYKCKIKISMTEEYYLLLTSNATIDKRKIWYRVEIENGD